VRRLRRRRELLVVFFSPADGVVLALLRHRGESVEVVDPSLHGDEARAAEPGPFVAHDRGLDRFPSLRVLGAVLVAGEVQAAAVLERVDRVRDLERGSEHLLQRAGAEQDLAAVLPAQPAPQRGGRRGHLHAFALIVRKRA